MKVYLRELTMKFKKIFTLSVSLLIAGFSIASCGNENFPLEQTLNIVG